MNIWWHCVYSNHTPTQKSAIYYSSGPKLLIFDIHEYMSYSNNFFDLMSQDLVLLLILSRYHHLFTMNVTTTIWDLCFDRMDWIVLAYNPNAINKQINNFCLIFFNWLINCKKQLFSNKSEYKIVYKSVSTNHYFYHYFVD